MTYNYIAVPWRLKRKKNQGSNFHIKCPVLYPCGTFSSNYTFCFCSWTFLKRSGLSSQAFFVGPVYHLATSGKAHTDADMIHQPILFVGYLRYSFSTYLVVLGTLPPGHINWAFPHCWLWRWDSTRCELSLGSPYFTCPQNSPKAHAVIISQSHLAEMLW